MDENRAVLRDGPYAGDHCTIEGTLPEHVRVWLCRNCADTHWASELWDEFPQSAARYVLANSQEQPVVYVHDGDSAPSGPREEEYCQRKPVYAGEELMEE